MRVTIVCWELPYPPDQGGKVDSWRRIESLKRCGVSVQLICWSYKKISQNDLDIVLTHVDVLRVMVIDRSVLFRLLKLPKLISYPLLSAVRSPSRLDFENVLKEVSCFDPSLILLDGIHGGALAQALAGKLDLPLVVRSHNIEHQYYKALLSASSDLKARLRSLLSLWHLREYEFKILSAADVFLDISTVDLCYWAQHGLHHGKWLPTFYPITTAGSLQVPSAGAASFSYDIGFLGNLASPNNVEGVRWLVEKVIPLIRKKMPGLKFLISGSSPIAEVVAMCDSAPDIHLIKSPKSSSEIYDVTRVMVNPVLRGSGVNVKAIELLLNANQVVTTSRGVIGLPANIVQHFFVEDDPEGFSQKVVECLRTDTASKGRRRLINEELALFDIETGGKHLVKILEDCVDSFQKGRHRESARSQ